MTRLGAYLQSRAINRAELSRLTGISTSRLQQLSTNKRTRLSVEEFYLIGLALDFDFMDMLKDVCKDYKLKKKK